MMSRGAEFRASSLFPPLVGLGGILSMIGISKLISRGYLPTFLITDYPQLNFLLTMQALVLPVSCLVLAAMYLYDRDNFRAFFRRGDVFAAAEPLKLLGIGEQHTWRLIGPILLIIVTSVTLTVTALGFREGQGAMSGRVLALFPFALIMAATNSWSEEIFGRFTVVAGLEGRVRATHKYLISAAIFWAPSLLRHAWRFTWSRADRDPELVAGEIRAGDQRHVLGVVYPFRPGRHHLHSPTDDSRSGFVTESRPLPRCPRG